jgi:hypothetical protein
VVLQNVDPTDPDPFVGVSTTIGTDYPINVTLNPEDMLDGAFICVVNGLCDNLASGDHILTAGDWTSAHANAFFDNNDPHYGG